MKILSAVNFSSIRANNLSSCINVKDPAYGAKGDGTTDDTAAFNAAISAATGAADPVTTTRTATAPVYMPAGTYKITSDLLIRSVSGFTLIGDGPGATTITASGTGFTQAVIFINGSLDGKFGGFALQGDGTEKCGSNNLYNGIRLDWIQSSRADLNCGTTNTSAVVTNTDAQVMDVGAAVTGTGIPASTTVSSVVPGVSWTLSHNCTATGSVTVTVASVNSAARSTTANRFSDIRVRALKTVIGVSLEGNGSAQVDGTVMDNIVVTGAQTPGSWSSSGLYQAGFQFGNGIFANNYDHVLTGCGTALYYYGMKVNVSSIDLDGSQPAANFADFWINTNGQTSIKNIQSQGSGQFLTTPVTFSPSPTTIEDVLFLTFNPNASFPVCNINGGLWEIRNFSGTSIFASSAYQTGVFNITGQNSSRPAIVSIENLCMFGTKTSVIVPSNANVLVKNYSNYNPNTGNYSALTAGDMLSYYSGSAWLSLDQGALSTTDVQFFTSNGTWTKPAGAKTVRATVLGGGAGGGSGASIASGTAAGGGGGGAGGGMATREFAASDLGSTVTVTVGAGGAGGAAAAAAVGNVGGNSTASSFGTALSCGLGMGGGAGGSAAAGAAGLSMWVVTSGNLGYGAAASATFGAGAGPANCVVENGQGGSSGGGITSGGTASNGGAGVKPLLANDCTVGAAGVVGGASPTAGTASSITNGSLGPSAGGGASSVTGNAQAGANALANSGAGGAGGGAALSTHTSGAGGNGGSGWVLVTTYF